MFKLDGLSWQTKLIVIIGVFLIGLVTGWRIHGLKTEAGLARIIAKGQKTAQKLQKKIVPVVEKKQSDLAEKEIIYKIIREKVYENNDQRICFADTAAWSLYNSSITGTDPNRPKPLGETGRLKNAEGQKVGAEENSEIVATVTDVLLNSADNFETCRRNSIKHNALIDAINIIKDNMCVCSQ